MKLFTRYSRINVLATIIIFLISGIAFYLTLNYVLLQQIDNDLKIEEGEITTYVNKHGRLPESISVKDQLISYTPTNNQPPKRHFSSYNIVDPDKKKEERFRHLLFGIQASGQWYQVTVSKSLEDTENLINSVLLITISTILAILVLSFIINRVVLKRIWKPFYYSLNAVKNFKISNNQPLNLPDAKIEEFSFMNETLKRITTQARHDYVVLKTFSENAAHELQTPIAIIRSKLDLMIQDEGLNENQSQALQSAYNAIQRLAKMNQSLLLLAKIENRQYEEKQSIELKQKLEQKLFDFQELWQSRSIKVQTGLSSVTIKMNNELADILLNNLLNNAIKHNYEGGWINVTLNPEELMVQNSSNGPGLKKEQLFRRFYKGSQNKEHNGLGLSIIKEICEASGYTVDYSFYNTSHSFTVRFRPAGETGR
jgi:signal transduction histidine kinase